MCTPNSSTATFPSASPLEAQDFEKKRKEAELEGRIVKMIRENDRESLDQLGVVQIEIGEGEGSQEDDFLAIGGEYLVAWNKATGKAIGEELSLLNDDTFIKFLGQGKFTCALGNCRTLAQKLTSIISMDTFGELRSAYWHEGLAYSPFNITL